MCAAGASEVSEDAGVAAGVVRRERPVEARLHPVFDASAALEGYERRCAVPRGAGGAAAKESHTKFAPEDRGEFHGPGDAEVRDDGNIVTAGDV